MPLSQKLLHTYAFFCVDPRALHKYVIISKNHFDNNYIVLMYTHCQNSYAVQDGYLFSNPSNYYLFYYYAYGYNDDVSLLNIFCFSRQDLI